MKSRVPPLLPGVLFAWIFLLAAAVVCVRAADAQGKIKLLIIEGVSNHDWKHRLELVRKILARDGSFDVDVSITGEGCGCGWTPRAQTEVLAEECCSRFFDGLSRLV